MKSENSRKTILIDCGTGDFYTAPIPEHLSSEEEVTKHLKRWLKDEGLVRGNGE
jgi:hypothetical protein